MKFVVTFLAILLGLLVLVAVFRGSEPPTTPQTDTDAQTPTAQTEDTQAPEQPDAASTDAAPADAAIQAADAEPDADGGDVAAEPAADAEEEAGPDLEAIPGLNVPSAEDVASTTLGSTDEASGYDLEVKLSPWGASVSRVALAGFMDSVEDDAQPYVLLDAAYLPTGKVDAEGNPIKSGVYPYASWYIAVNGGSPVALYNVAWTAGEVVTNDAGQSVTYTAEVLDADGNAVLRLIRTYSLQKGSYEIELRQRFTNLSATPLSVVWGQRIQGDLTKDDAAYLGDRRQFATGYFKPLYDPGKTSIYTENGFHGRSAVLDSKTIWTPNPEQQLAWLASENRYFAVVTHRPVAEGATKASDVPALEAAFPSVGVRVWRAAPEEDQPLLFTLESKPLALAPAGDAASKAELDLAVFAGPRQKEIFASSPYDLLGLVSLVRYELSCTWCTFQFLAKGLLWLLKLFHGDIIAIGGFGIGLHDWGLSIILLVLCVRLALHPITKRAQINMMKMGKQMQALQPEMEKLKKKYADDQQKLNAETMKLYREKGVNPASALGCAPMFLQMPIWVALYAMLYYAIELRHEPAFYGVFQAVSGGQWSFLKDLSSPDNFIRLFDTPKQVSLLFIHLNFQAINILPLLMAVVFFFQQKFTTPPPTNDQAAQQQKIMKFMVLLFPIMLYGAPSGLTLYICASTAAGMLDSYIVRKHVREMEEAGTLFDKKPRKPGGFMDRVNSAMEQRQQTMQQQANKRGPRKRR